MCDIRIEHITEFDPSLCKPIEQLLHQLSSRKPNFTQKELHTIIECASTRLMVMYTDQQLVGMLSLAHYDTPTGRKVWIEDVVVDSSMRGKGLGRLLINEAIAYARTLAPCSLLLTSRPSRIAANELYRSAGFEQRQTNVYKMDF